MSFFKRVSADASKTAGTIIGNHVSANVQNATDSVISGMELFQRKAAQTANATFDTAKGSLFEYIEAAKFNRNAAISNSSARAVVTDAIGNPHAVADIIIEDNGETVKEIQAKFSQTFKGGKDTSAATSVFEQTGAMNKGWGQYHSMDRLIRKEENYNNDGSLLDESRKLAKARADTGGIHADEYQDVYEHLTDETSYRDVSSGGTTIEEIREAYDNPSAYSRRLELRQVKQEIGVTAINMAKASFVTSGIVSGITNMFDVYRNDKSLADALQDVGADAVKSGVRGGATGALSTVIRYNGVKEGSKLLSDSTAATVMAGGIIDGGVALYSYAKGEISAEELRNELLGTTAKATTTIFYTKAVTAILGKAVNPFIPMAVYTTASYVITCTREIIKEAKLNTEEYERMTALLEESTLVAREYHAQFREHIALCEAKQSAMLERFIEEFNYNLETGDNYDQAVYAIVKFADQAGISLQYVSFNDFKNAMNSHSVFELN